MTQHITIESHESVSVNMSAYESLRDPSGERERYNPHRYEYVHYLADTVNRDAVASDLETQLSGSEWTRVTWKWQPDEYDDAQYRDDPDYALADHGLVAPVSFEADGWELTVSYAVETFTETFDPPTDYRETHTITHNGVELGTVTVKDPLDHIPLSGPEPREYPPEAPDDETLVSIGERPESNPSDERIHRLAKGIGADGPVECGISRRIDTADDELGELFDITDNLDLRLTALESEGSD